MSIAADMTGKFPAGPNLKEFVTIDSPEAKIIRTTATVNGDQ